MKADIHPKVRTVIFQDSVNGAMYRIDSAVQTKDTVIVNGTEYPLVKLDVTSASHPFYTGNQRIMDTAGRVEKFGSKYGANLSRLAKKKGKA
ncbi:MAG: type B 50S ribosomal protein L31 [Planctomycetota bacterium]|nr:MAG: type B 50S ribosomal protein L31 [Planctomycetota bacterium]